MFESAELGHSVDDAAYRKQVAKLRGDLLDAQYELLERKTFSVVVLVNGEDGAGKGEAVNLLNEWMDPRHIKSYAFGKPSPEQAERPEMWKFWQSLPPLGEIGILFGSWYSDPIENRVSGKTSRGQLAVDISHIRRLERMLADEQTLVLKLWFHLSKKAQKKRLETLEKNKLTRWRVTKQDWERHERYDRYRQVVEPVLRDTSTGEAPWIVIDGSDPNYCSLTVGKVVLAALQRQLAIDANGTSVAGVTSEASGAKKKSADVIVKKAGKAAAGANGVRTNGVRLNGRSKGHAETVPLIQTVDSTRILTDLPFKERLSKEKYAVEIEKVQGSLAKLSRSASMKKHSVVVVFEGMDAAGKGGAIRRVTRALDARMYSVIPIAAPTDEEKAHPYLWRFWRHMPRHGHFVIYDRSWYGRVLVERVEGFASEAAWTRAYSEITDFEEQLADSGIVMVKLWLAITKEEQLRRFKEREATRFKRYKITDDDWRNRKKWDAYVEAASDMIDRTSTRHAPWTVIEANDKHLARVRAIQTISEQMKRVF